MYRQARQASVTSAVIGALVLISSGIATAGPLTVTNDFVAGQPATAATVNQNFTDTENAVNDNDARITTNSGNIADNFSMITDHEGRISSLESSVATGTRAVVNVDCTANPDAFLQPPLSDYIAPNTTLNITGDCNGPVVITSDGVWLVGSEPNRAASIVLPAATPNPALGTIFADGAHDLRIENLLIDASAWGTAAAEGTDAAGLYARNAFVRLIDSDIQGGLWGTNPFRDAVVRMQGTVNITEFVNSGISVGDHSLVTTRGPVNLSTTRTDGSYVAAIEVYRLGIADFRGGLTVTLPAEDPIGGFFPTSLSASQNSHVRVRNSGTINVAGNMYFGSGADALLQGGTYSGNISVNLASKLRLFGVNHTGTTVDLSMNSIALFVDTTAGEANVGTGAVLEVSNGSLNGALLNRGSQASIFGASITGDISLSEPTNLYMIGGAGASLNGNTVNLCNNTNSTIDSDYSSTGTVLPSSC